MPTKNPRLNIVIEPKLYSLLCKLSDSKGISLSLYSRDLIKEALEVREDLYWQEVASKRDKELSHSKHLSHKDVWK
jgi:hypothetical protein